MSGTGKAKASLFLTVFLDLLGFGIVIPILPLYAKQISANPSPWMERINVLLALQEPGAFWAGVAFASYSLMQFLASPVLGRISDKVGRRPILAICMVGSACGFIVLGLTHHYEWVLFARVLDGITGGNIGVAHAAMADLTPERDRSKAMGMLGAALGMGFVLGPALAGLLSGTHFGPGLPFFVAAGLSLVAAAMVVAWLPETLSPELRASARERETRGHAMAVTLRHPGMRPVLGVALLGMSAFAMMEGTFSLLANDRFGFDQRHVGFLFGVVGVLIVIYQGGLVRLVAHRIPERTALLMGVVLTGSALAFLPWAPWRWPFLLLLIPLSWGSGMSGTAVNALASQLSPADQQGSTFGALSAVQGLGRILGPAIGTFAFARFGHPAPYILATCILAVGVFLVPSIPRRQPVS